MSIQSSQIRSDLEHRTVQSGLCVFPVRPETLVTLQLLFSEPTIDLREVSAVILGDLGATLHVYQLMSEMNAGTFSRVEDCVATLAPDFLLRSLSNASELGNMSCADEFAQHCGAVAECAQAIARMCPGIDAEHAYLAGLLHERRRMKELFGVSFPSSLPDFVVGELCCADVLNSEVSRITEIVAAAHEVVMCDQDF